ncbi:hypothetical protein CR513_46311, partial [Mucuna pruriens]
MQKSPCRSDEPVCEGLVEDDGPLFYLYDTLPLKLRIQLPFTQFERAVLRTLNIAPTQPHPNSWAFLQVFELLSEDIRRAPSLRSVLPESDPNLLVNSSDDPFFPLH